MAYVAARSNGRFEVRESVHTPSGPRARTLAGFTMLTSEVLEKAAQRATRPFDADAVIASGRKAGTPMQLTGEPSGGFVGASRRMAASLRRSARPSGEDPGAALIDLLGFADAVRAGQPARPAERLGFPALAALIAPRAAAARAR